jgi:DNA-directed RNA polymerase subunit N (RpoN/RPB10)
MIIPIRCFTCNQVIAHKWETYHNKIQENYLKENVVENQKARFVNIQEIKNKTNEGKILDELDVHRYCCRRMFLSHVDMTEII